MARLVASVDAEIATLFGILTVARAGVAEGTGSAYAVSRPGGISLRCGTANADAVIRVERWDGRPPAVEGWEDSDELPFTGAEGEGALVVSGFDPGVVELEIDGLDSARVQVLARGRHRYDAFGSSPEGLPPEEWLLRLHPARGHPDPLAGGPRVLASLDRARVPTPSPWRAALQSWRDGGWDVALAASEAYRRATSALDRAAHPISRRRLAELMVALPPAWPTTGDPLVATVPVGAAHGHDPLAVFAGSLSPLTVGESIVALERLGLLLGERRGRLELLVPHPSPAPVWERIAMSAELIALRRAQSLRTRYDAIRCDLRAALDWAGARGIEASPRTLATRWAASVDDIVGALRLMGGEGDLSAGVGIGFDTPIDPDAPLRLVVRER